MCRIEECERHELWGGLCLPHLKEELAPKPKRKRTTKKKVDSAELNTTDAPVDEMETR